MIYFDRIHENKLYNRFPISGIDSTTQNKKTGTCILLLGRNTNEVIDTINARVFLPMNFKSFYVPRKATNKVNKKVKFVKQRDYYDNIKLRTDNVSIFLSSLESYKSKNLFYDMSQDIDLFETTFKRAGKFRVDAFYNMIVAKIEEIKKLYNNVIILTPIFAEEDISFTNINKAHTVAQYMYHITKEGKMNGNLVMYLSPAKKIYTQAVVTEDNIKDNLAKIKRLQNKVNNIEVDVVDDDIEDETIADSPADKVIKQGTNNKPDEEIVQIDNKNDEIIENAPDEKVEAETANILKKVGVNAKKVDSTIQPLVLVMQDMIQDVLKTKDEEQTVEEVLNNSPEFMELFMELNDIIKIGKDKVENAKKIEKLTKKQKSIDFGEFTMDDILNQTKDLTIEKIDLPANTIDKKIRTSSVNNFDMAYQEKILNKDVAKIFTSFNNDPDIKIFATKVEKEDTSTDLTKKMTYRVGFEDDKGIKHNVTFDVPIIKDGKFMKINGGKKLLQKQILLLPIIKTHPDKVQITSNYNKFFIERFGQKTSSRLEGLKRVCNSDYEEFKKPNSKLVIKKGDSSIVNGKLETTLEYLDLSGDISEIITADKDIMFNFNLIKNMTNPNNPSFNEEIFNKYSEYEKDYMMIGTLNKKDVIMIDRVTGKVFELVTKPVEKADSLFDYILGILEEELEPSFFKLLNKKPAKSFTYSRISINSKKLPLIVVLGYELGLTEVLKRYEIDYEFVTERPEYIASAKKDIIPFYDGFLVYDSSEIRNSLLLNGLSSVGCDNYSFNEMDTLEPYLDMFFNITGSRNAGKGIHNNLSLMIDPITLDVLKELKLPENIFDILLYANTLLEGVDFKRMNDMSTYRIRGAEQLPAIIYNCLANYIREYKDHSRNGNTNVRISMPRDIVIKKILESHTVDEYSVLNPSLNF